MSLTLRTHGPQLAAVSSEKTWWEGTLGNGHSSSISFFIHFHLPMCFLM